MAVGAVLQGFPLTHEPNQVPTYVGGALRFISAFSIWTGVAAVIAVSLSGGLFIRARFEPAEPIRQKAAVWTNYAFYLALSARDDHRGLEPDRVSLGLRQLARSLLLGLGTVPDRGDRVDVHDATCLDPGPGLPMPYCGWI